MIENEITETYYFKPTDFNKKGRRISDGMTFRDVVKEFERDFHERHSTEYALNLYANSQTMDLLAKSNDAAPFLLYGMDLTQGNRSMPFKTLLSITKWKSVVRRFMYMVLTLLL